MNVQKVSVVLRVAGAHILGAGRRTRSMSSRTLVVWCVAATVVLLSLAVGCAGSGGRGAANAPSGAKGSVLKTIRIE
jgi:hypothetical protein